MAAAKRSTFTKRKRAKLSGGANLLIAIIAVIAAAAALYWFDIDLSGVKTSSDGGEPVDGTAYVHFIDVGQGDSELLIADDGTTMLIDAGEPEYGAVVAGYIKDLGITRLDYVIGTHPHSDHIGGLKDVIASDLEIGRVITPKVPEEYTPTTKSYEGFIDAVADKGCELTAVKDESFSFGSGTITVIGTDYSGDNYNNYSAVVRFDFGDVSFLFTGDIEKMIEKQLVEAQAPIDADVLKVAHHGSSTSSCYDFLDAVTPEYCVIECGDSSYNHPNPDTVTRLRSYTENIYRTDNQGTVVFSCDGSGVSITTQR